MKAIQMTAPGAADVLKLREVVGPKCRDRNVLIRNYATGLNEVDLLLRSGLLPEAFAPQMPITLGMEGAGIVEEVGDRVEDLMPGDRVMWLGDPGAGGYSQYTLLSPHQVIKIPDSVSFIEAAAVPFDFICASYLLHELCDLEPGKPILIHNGDRGIGAALIQLAGQIPVQVFTTASAANIALLPGAADQVVLDGRDHDLAYKLKRHRKPFAAIFNPLATHRDLKLDLELISPFGHLVIHGLGGQLPDYGQGMTRLLEAYRHKAVALTFFNVFSLQKHKTQLFQRIFKRVAGWLVEGRIKPRLGQTMALSDVAAAHRLAESPDQTGKIVFEVNV